MTLDHLVNFFPLVRFEITDGKKRLARVQVEYQVVGTAEGLVNFLQELEKEWPFAVQVCKENHVLVEYLVKSGDAEKFCRRVSYRGKKVVVVF